MTEELGLLCMALISLVLGAYLFTRRGDDGTGVLVGSVLFFIAFVFAGIFLLSVIATVRFD